MGGPTVRRASVAFATLALAFGWIPSSAAQERGTDAGWTNVLNGMRHFKFRNGN